MKDRFELDEQQRHWQDVYLADPGKFGKSPSVAALRALEVLSSRRDVKSILELGSGAGRDTLCFARRGFAVTATDYATSATTVLAGRAAPSEAGHITIVNHDVRRPLPFEDHSFDACYSHMLLCMALTTQQIESLLREIWRVLRPGGL